VGGLHLVNGAHNNNSITSDTFTGGTARGVASKGGCPGQLRTACAWAGARPARSHEPG